jgi:hypothetical protein
VISELGAPPRLSGSSSGEPLMPPKHEDDPDRSAFIPDEKTNGSMLGGRDDLD